MKVTLINEFFLYNDIFFIQQSSIYDTVINLRKHHMYIVLYPTNSFKANTFIRPLSRAPLFLVHPVLIFTMCSFFILPPLTSFPSFVFLFLFLSLAFTSQTRRGHWKRGVRLGVAFLQDSWKMVGTGLSTVWPKGTMWPSRRKSHTSQHPKCMRLLNKSYIE